MPLERYSLERISVERACADDAEAITALVRQARINPTSLDWRNFVVARHPDHGLVACGQIRNAPLTRGREVKSLVVLPEYRDGRLSRAILRELIEGECGVVWGTCVASLAPYYTRFGCEIVPKHETPLYYRLMSRVAARVHRKRTGRDLPEMVVLRWHGPYTPGK
jgi:N-acetylglutamate synthase-like GNAT family acetyltransferase